MDQLVFSILTQGLLTPISVRPIEHGKYEVISGHRRLHACKKARIKTVSALIYSLNDGWSSMKQKPPWFGNYLSFTPEENTP